MLAVGDTLLLPGAAELARLHAAELPQKDELCGAFGTLLALRLAGVELAGEPLDQDAVGLAAGSVLGPHGDHDALPPEEPGRRDYRLQHPRTDDEKVSGTSAGGLVRAVDQLTHGRRTTIPVAGPWTPESVDHVIGVVAAEDDAALLLNVGTGFFWGARPQPAQMLAYLTSGDDAEGPAPDWSVGHFVGCLGAQRGPRGTLLIITDTYPSLGLRGVHLQPRERVAAALRREGMTPGGALVILPSERSAAVEAALSAGELELSSWDNGSLDAWA